jgi:esterase/lipase superfamily enzyme
MMLAAAHRMRTLFAVASLATLAACQPPVEMMPPPTLFVNGEHNLFGANANLDRSNEIQVFYATNRMPVGPVGTYTIFPDDQLHMGVASLSIGGGNRSWDWLYSLSTGNTEEAPPQILLDAIDREASVRVGTPVDRLGEEALAFFRSIDAALATAADKDLTIYVHGANTSVGRATGQAAQYRHFTGRNSVVLSYIWPSAENFLRFGHDVNSAARTAPAFAHLLRMLAAHTRAQHIDVIAYSSGAMVASPGLALLGTVSAGYDPASMRLGEVYYPAPDADFRRFVSELQVYHAYPQRVTVTANLHDSVLVLSRLHQRGSRAGRPDPDELSAEDSRWMIEASNNLGFDLLSARSEDLPGMDRRSHIFWYDHPWVSSDVLLKMLFHLSPQDRGLLENSRESGLKFWTFPEDYEERLKRVRDGMVEAARNAPAQGTSPTAP